MARSVPLLAFLALLAVLPIDVAPRAARAAPSLTWLPPVVPLEPGPISDGLDASFLSADGTIVAGIEDFHNNSIGQSTTYAVSWNGGGGWAGTQISVACFFPPCLRSVALSATNVLALNDDALGGFLAANAVPPLKGLGEPGLCSPPSLDHFFITAISADGLTVTGANQQPFGNGATCGSMVGSLGTTPTIITPPGSFSTSISDDGRAVAGYVDHQPRLPFVWSSGGGYHELPVQLYAPFDAPPLRISGDGSTVIGTASTANGVEAFAWDAVHGVTSIGDLPGGDVRARAIDVARDGSIVAGTGSAPFFGGISMDDAFAWTREGGIVGLGIASSSTVDMTPNGLVVGRIYDRAGEHVFVWNPRTGWMRTVESMLRDAGISVPDTGLDFPVGISDDGRVIAGNYVLPPLDPLFPPVFQAWVATIDPPGFACDVTMSQASYANGQPVVITSLRFTNNDTAPTEARLRLQLTLPFGITANALDLGAGGGFFVPASFDKQLGPVTMFTLQPGQPRGNFQWRCALEDPHTGAVLAEDVAPFTFQ
jgi:uncharacterized membrane protein